jgi:hypothetical protein
MQVRYPDELAQQRPTIDLDPTDTEVYGRKKEGSDYNYEGRRVYRPLPAVWAEAGWHWRRRCWECPAWLVRCSRSKRALGRRGRSSREQHGHTYGVYQVVGGAV